MEGEEDRDKKGEKKPSECPPDNIVKDGVETTTISLIHEHTCKEIGVSCPVRCALKALYERLDRLFNCFKSLREALGEDFVIICKVMSHYAFGIHSICGTWCQYRVLETQRQQSLYYGKDLDGDKLKAVLEQLQKRTNLVISEKTNKQLDYIITKNKELEEQLSNTRSDHDAKIFALQSDVKSLKESVTDCSKNEQESLAECRTLQESAASEKNKRELALCGNESHMTSENEQLRKYQRDIEKLKESLSETRSDYDAEVSALQSDISSLKGSLTECRQNEQKALEECRTLQEAVKLKNELECTLCQKEDHIKAMESEIRKYQADIEKLEELLAETNSGHDSEISALQTVIKSLKASLKECVENKQRALSESRTLQEAVKDNKETQAKLREKENQIKALEAEVAKKNTTDAKNKVLAAKYTEEMLLRKKLHNELVDLKGNIRVYCRVRPAIKEDGDGDAVQNAISFDEDDDGIIEVASKSGRPQKFVMDMVFKPDATQEEVFDEVKSLIVSCIDGYNVCIFAYGQTGSGKTFTMEGLSSNPGIYQRALRLLFEETSGRRVDWQFTIYVSVLEIYNEMLRDLLGNDPSAKLEIRKGPEGIFVPGLTEKQVKNVDEVNKVFAIGKTNRATATTDMNEHSSRSHALLCVTVVGVNQTTGQETKGKLNLVDLAGNERISKSGAEGARMTEAVNINTSLSCLGKVIHSLKNKDSHIPYRDSKLTYLLQESLGGDSKTLMVVQVSPVEKNLTETVCSLHFAQGVRTVELGQATRKTASVEHKKKSPQELEGLQVTPPGTRSLSPRRKLNGLPVTPPGTRSVSPASKRDVKSAKKI
ncbi:kinesin-like protein KIFC3 isoform X1 [Montipora foliosa]|uniref:kinesin-like protein KIFC3 isoform X1 n=1 Tax=Montipora foliosa TaxID=591990 RepID=UPI0035F20E2B